MNLNGISVPDHYNGIGLHDTVGAETAVWDYRQATNHARELRAKGVTLYKLFGSGTKGDRARAYRDNGITVLHRWWPGSNHWGRPPQDWLMPKADYDYLLGCGVSLFEPGWNEFNIAYEWAGSIPNARGIATTVVDAWEAAKRRYGNTDHLLFPSNTPGGHVDHRLCYQRICEELALRGLEETVKHVAIHNRPLNNPPHLSWTAPNTCTFDEWRWIRDRFASFGMRPYFWATESGYELGWAQNGDYPPIDMGRWLAYNQELFLRMNPKDISAIEPEFAGFCHWYEAGWGAYGSDNLFAKEALRDSPDDRMPEPSPLWEWMDDSTALNFRRYPDAPTPPEHPIIEACEAMPKNPDKSTEWPVRDKADIKRIVIHHSVTELGEGQSELDHLKAIARGHIRIANWWTIGYHWCVIDDEEGGAHIYRVNPMVCTTNHVGGYNSTSVGVCMIGKLHKREPTAAQLDATAWLVAQLGWPAVPHRDLNQTACPGTWDWSELQRLIDKYREGDTPEPPEEGTMNIVIRDKAGNLKDWAWVQATYGGITIDAITGDGYRVTQLTEVEGIMAFRCTVLNEAGGPVAGIAVRYAWPDDYRDEITNGSGMAEHTAGPDEGYDPANGPGAISWQVQGQPSEKINGLGWLWGTNHDHLQVTMQWAGPDEPTPEPPDGTDLTPVVERLDTIITLLSDIKANATRDRRVEVV